MAVDMVIVEKKHYEAILKLANERELGKHKAVVPFFYLAKPVNGLIEAAKECHDWMTSNIKWQAFNPSALEDGLKEAGVD